MPIDPDVRVDSVAGLRELYREPSSLVRRKVHTSLDAETAAAVRAARFVLVATVGADGHVDVSPRGGPPGFVQVDEGRILLPDLNGNNLIDSLINVVETGRIGLLVVHPGHDETLRVNGTAWVTADPDTTSRFDDVVRRPKTVIVIEPDEVFIHCAKAFRRGGVWDAATWNDGIDAVSILQCQLGLPGDADALRADFEQGYASELAEDRPV
jgi:uncharacterized protein